jgi:hypothetical protein
LGFKISYYDGSTTQEYAHHSFLATDEGMGISTVRTFTDGEYISGYQVSVDSVRPTAAVAFTLAVSDDSTVTCGNIDINSVLDESRFEIGDCEVIPIGFSTGVAFDFGEPFLI